MEKTIVNLSKAFVGESQARNRYTMYAKIAKKEGYEEIAANFESTATKPELKYGGKYKSSEPSILNLILGISNKQTSKDFFKKDSLNFELKCPAKEILTGIKKQGSP